MTDRCTAFLSQAKFTSDFFKWKQDVKIPNSPFFICIKLPRENFVERYCRDSRSLPKQPSQQEKWKGTVTHVETPRIPRLNSTAQTQSDMWMLFTDVYDFIRSLCCVYSHTSHTGRWQSVEVLDNTGDDSALENFAHYVLISWFWRILQVKENSLFSHPSAVPNPYCANFACVTRKYFFPEEHKR